MDVIPAPDRRRFVNWFLGTSFGALIISIIYPIARFLTPPRIAESSSDQVEAGDSNDPQLREKGFKIIRFGAEPVIVVRVAEGNLRAFSATCTHLDCIVGYRKDRSLIWCNCHGGAYDLNGRNVGGPPPRPLTAYAVNLVPKGDASVIVVSRA